MATTRQRSSVALRLVAVGPDGERRDVLVEAAADAPARELAAALATEVGAGPSALLYRDGEELPPDVPLAELALRHGELLRFSPEHPSESRERLELVVAGGPAAGRRIPLAPGTHRVGRDAEIAIKRQLRGTMRVGTLHIGDLTALRYPQLPATESPYRNDLTLVPISDGAVAVECLTPRVLGADQKPADCATVVSTLKLNGLHQLPLDGTSSYTQTVASIVTRLDGERLAGRRQLAGSMRRIEEARAAHNLAAAFAGASYRLNHVQPTPFARPSHAALYGALREAQRAYEGRGLDRRLQRLRLPN